MSEVLPAIVPKLPSRKSVIFHESVRQSPLEKNDSILEEELLSVDDERNQRRNNANLKKRLSNITHSSFDTSSSEKDVKDHIMSVLKMCAENKISQKNVWNIRIIDFIKNVFQNKEFSQDSLQVSASSLDASAKVYTIRVDDIYAEGMKLASAMARKKQNQGNVSDGECSGEDAPEHEQSKTKKQMKRKRKKFQRGQKNTIAKDINSITGDLPKLESTGFRSKVNESNAGNTDLFCLSLPMDYSGEAMLLCNENPFSYGDPLVFLENKCQFMGLQSNLKICPQLANFEIDIFNPQKENDYLLQNTTTGKEVMYDDNGLPIAELDGSICDEFSVPPPEVAGDMEDFEYDKITDLEFRGDEVRDISSFKASFQNTVLDSDYSYHSMASNKFVSLVWAGPSHWKLKHIRRKVPRFTGQVDKLAPKQKRKVKEAPVPFDFENPPPLFNLMKTYAMVTKYFKKSSQVTLPFKFDLNNSRNIQLISKEAYVMPSTLKKSNVEMDLEKQDYDYNNPNDSLYCSENNLPEYDAIVEEEEVVQPQLNFFPENLVDAPEMVEKNYIQYLKVSHKMDMKKLKASIWRGMVSSAEEPYDAINEKTMFSKQVQSHNFSEIMQLLKEKLNNKMKESLNDPIAFVALLHLCNEHNLKLTQNSSYNNFTIMQDL